MTNEELLSHFEQYLEEEKRYPKTVHNYCRHVSQFLEFHGSLTNFNADDVQRFEHFLGEAQGLSQATLKTAKQSLRRFREFLAKEYHITVFFEENIQFPLLSPANREVLNRLERHLQKNEFVPSVITMYLWRVARFMSFYGKDIVSHPFQTSDVQAFREHLLTQVKKPKRKRTPHGVTRKERPRRKKKASFKLTKQSLENLRNEGTPDEILEGLKVLVDQAFKGKNIFLNAVEKQIGSEQTVRYKESILKRAQISKREQTALIAIRHLRTVLHKEYNIVTFVEKEDPADVLPHDNREKLDKFISYLRDEGKNSETIRHRRTSLIQFMNYIDKDIITIQTCDIEAFKEHCRKQGNSTTTINGKLTSIRMLFKFIQEEYGISHMKVKIKPYRIQKKWFASDYFKESEFQRIFRAAEKKGDLLAMALIATLWQTGARVREVTEFPKSALNQDWITLVGKGSKERIIPVTRSLQSVLKKYWNSLSERKKNSPYLFPGRDPRKPLNPQTVRDKVKYYGGQARGIPLKKLRPHNFRHGFARFHIEHGIPLKQLKDLLGHEKIETTARYLDYTRDETLKRMNGVYNEEYLTKCKTKG